MTKQEKISELYSKYGYSEMFLYQCQLFIDKLEKDAYNKALNDATLLSKVEYVMVESGNNPRYEYQVDKESILKLKKQ